MCPDLFHLLTKRVETIDGQLSLNIAIYSVKDRPKNRLPVLLDRFIKVKESEQLYQQLHGMDPEGDSFTFHLTKNAEHGFADMDTAGNIFYTPHTHYIGVDTVHIQLKETTVRDGSPPKISDEVLLIKISHVNNPPIVYYLPPHNGEFRVENNAKIEIDIRRPKSPTSDIVELGHVAGADWDIDDEIVYQLISLNKASQDHTFQLQQVSLPESVWMSKLSDIRGLPQKTVSKISVHFLSEFTGTLAYEVQITDQAGAGVKLDLYLKVTHMYWPCSQTSGCTDHVTAKSIP